MNVDPRGFFVGLVDFFSIFLPGALLTFLFGGELGPVVLGAGYAGLTGAEGWAAFLVASYLLGHVVFLLGSPMDRGYDRLRGGTTGRQIAALAAGEPRPGAVVRSMARFLFGGERDLALSRARDLKVSALRPLRAEEAINAFQWSKALLTLDDPAGLAGVQRFEADSKFFRSFAVVLLVVLLTWPWHRRWPVTGAPVVLLLLLLALWRYCEQRYKSTNQAYWAVLTLAARNRAAAGGAPAPGAPAEPVRVGALVHRGDGAAGEYLLAEDRAGAGARRLISGTAEPGDDLREAVVRTVLEGAGVWARVREDLGEVTHRAGGVPVVTRVFLLEAVGEPDAGRGDRRHAWVPLAAALGSVDPPEVAELLRAATAGAGGGPRRVGR